MGKAATQVRVAQDLMKYAIGDRSITPKAQGPSAPQSVLQLAGKISIT